jgi:hypothetical protein
MPPAFQYRFMKRLGLLALLLLSACQHCVRDDRAWLSLYAFEHVKETTG